MEHITIKDLKNGYFKLIPDNGYMLYNKVTMQTYSEAVVKEKDEKKFIAILKEPITEESIDKKDTDEKINSDLKD